MEQIEKHAARLPWYFWVGRVAVYVIIFFLSFLLFTQTVDLFARASLSLASVFGPSVDEVVAVALELCGGLLGGVVVGASVAAIWPRLPWGVIPSALGLCSLLAFMVICMGPKPDLDTLAVPSLWGSVLFGLAGLLLSYRFVRKWRSKKTSR